MSTMPLGYLLGGVLADGWFEPKMMVGGSLTAAFGWLVGVGVPGWASCSCSPRSRARP
jgi:hypothetical protein